MANEIINMNEHKMEGTRKDVFEINYNNFNGNVVLCLVNTESNKKLLSKVPHRKFLDLSVMYRWMLDVDQPSSSDVIHSIVVTNEMMEVHRLNEKKLYELAYNNTKRLLPLVVVSLSNIQEVLDEASDFEEEEDADAILSGYVAITNKRMIYGATALLYPDTLHEIASKCENDLLIIPSSTHDLIALSDDGDVTGLAEMVWEVNHTEVVQEERLSNNVYHYDWKERKVTLATNVKNATPFAV